MLSDTERLFEEQAGFRIQKDNVVLLNERRRIALAEIDRASFSYVLPPFELLPLRTMFPQPIPCQDLPGSRRWFLYGCVSVFRCLNEIS